MSITSALARIDEIKTQASPPAVSADQASPEVAFNPLLERARQNVISQAPVSAPLPICFASPIAGVSSNGGTATNVGERIVSLARAELERGIRENPPGANDSPDIARYRTATQGAVRGAPWCAYFVSYIAQQAGVPIGPNGSGLGYVPSVESWAKQNGKWIPAGQLPNPGDLIVFNQHIGIVESVSPDGQVTTIEGNSSNAVSERFNRQGAARGYVRLG